MPTTGKLKLFILGTLMSLMAVPVTAEEVNTNGLETLRKTSKAFSAVSKKATPAVVAVQVRTKVTSRGGNYSGSPFDNDFFERFFGERYRRQPRERWMAGQASGFIISEDGYVLTNHHVVNEADEIKIVLTDGREFDDVELIGSDDKADVAVLKINKAKDLPTVELGNSDDLEIGEWVIAIGNPFGLTETLTVGVVSALGRKLGGTEMYQDFIQTDAAINPGNSGGPLLNLEGKVIGINSAIITGDRGYMGIGLAVPINMAAMIKDQLVNTGKVDRGYLGVRMQDVDPDMAEFFKLESNNGAVITHVEEDSPADKAGLKKDDVIIKIGKKNVEDVQDVFNIIGFTAPESKVDIVVIRNGKRKTIDAVIGSRTQSEMADTSEIGKKLGLTVRTIDAELAKEYSITEGRGVVVTDVAGGSEAEYKGFQAGMVILEVNRYEINNVGAFNKALDKTKDNKVYLFVKTGRHYGQYVVLTLKED